MCAKSVNTYTNLDLCKFRVFFGLFAMALLVWSRITSADSHSFQLDPSNGEIRQVKASLLVKGNLKIKPEGKDEAQSLPLNLKADLYYDEKVVQSSTPFRTVRHYREAKADIQIDKNKVSQALADEHRLIIVNASNDRATMFSAVGHLSRDELDLITTQGNSIFIHSLLPTTSKSVGETWKHDNRAIAALLNLDSITKSEVESKLAEVKDGIGVIETAGSISGAANGVATDLNIKAKCNFDFKLKHITGFAIAIQEKRSETIIEPGFEVIAQLRMAMRPIDESPHLTDQTLASIPLESKPENSLLQYESTLGGFGFLHERRWHVMLDRENVTVLRLVDEGDFVGQCNVSRLSNLPEGKQLSLEEFQADIQKSLADSFGQFVEASQATTKDGMRILRVAVAGSTSDVPIHWIYFHLANDKGQRASCVFTMQSKLIERFGAADSVVVSSLQLRERSERDDSKSPTPAAARQADASSKDPLSSTSN